MKYGTYRSKNSRWMVGRRKSKNGKVLPPEFQGKVQLDENEEWVQKQKKPRISYPQVWPLYNRAQIQEKLLFYKILNDAVNYLDIDEKFGYRGKPRIPMRDLVKACVIKVYCGFSSRRAMSELQMVKGLGYLQRTPSFNTLIDAFDNPEVEKHLSDLYRVLALPLKGVEKSFSVDSTGFSTTLKSDWVSEKFTFKGKGKWEWRKLHAVCGNLSNVVTSVKITKERVGDSPQFRELVSDTAKSFNIGEMCADSAYLSADNVTLVGQLGGVPYIKPKSDTFLSASRGKGAEWLRLIRMWRNHRDEFKKHYHFRSNIEATFSMMKRKFSGSMRNRNEQAQRNEILSKVVCHNGSVLVNSIFELGVELNWS